MYQIAICDNQRAELAITRQIVQEWIDECGKGECRLDCFTDSGELIDEMRRGKLHDVYLLEAVLDGYSGIELGRHIRLRTDFAQIIYITSSGECMLRAFENHALHYMLKPVQGGELKRTLELAWRLRHYWHGKRISVHTTDGIENVELSQIIYVENVERSAVYHLSDGTILYGRKNRGTFEEAIAPLTREADFFSPHKSFWLNRKYVSCMGTAEFKMSGGARIPISRNRLRDVKKSYLAYISCEKE